MGRHVLQSIRDNNRVNGSRKVKGFIDDRTELAGTSADGVPVLGDREWLKGKPEIFLTVAVCDPRTKKKIVEELKTWGHTSFATTIHSRAWVADNVRIGEGTIRGKESSR